MRLVHQTFVVLAIVVLIAVGSMAALFALTLESGFVAYVNSRQQDQFDAFHRLLVTQVQLDGSLDRVMHNEFIWRRMMRLAEGEAEGDGGLPLDAVRDDGARRKGYGRRGGRPGDKGIEGLDAGTQNPVDSQRPSQESMSGAQTPTINATEAARPGAPSASSASLPQDGAAGVAFDDRPPAPPGKADDRPPPPPPRADDRPPPRDFRSDDGFAGKGFRDRDFRGPPGAGGGPGARRGPPDNNPYGLGQSIVLLAADRTPVYRRPTVLTRNVTPLEREVKSGDRVEGYVQLWPIDKLERPEDLAYLRTQYRQLAWGTAALIVLMLAIAPLVARRVTRPLRSVAEATERIAHGDLDVRLPTTRNDEIGTLMVNVNAMVDSLHRLEQTRRRWIAEIAHELRTPLTVLQAELEALAVGVRPLGSAAIASLQDETRQLTRLVGDLHQLALADLDALPVTMGPVDVADLARRVAERFRVQAEKKGLRLDLDIASAAIPLEADAQRLEQLIGNLLQNSIRYTDSPGRIVVRAARRNGAAEIVVEDSPPAVGPDDYERLFDPLYRADAARSRKSGGSGLGLAIARAIALAHGGKIAATPSKLGGLRLEVTLPIQ